MNKIASFIVEKRGLLIAVVLSLALVCALFIPRVSVNSDLTKYLPDDSPMKRGMDVMQEAFPGTAADNTIRVMFTGLNSGERLQMKDRLSGISYVTKVDYLPEDEEYNRNLSIVDLIPDDKPYYWMYHQDSPNFTERKKVAEECYNAGIGKSTRDNLEDIDTWIKSLHAARRIRR